MAAEPGKYDQILAGLGGPAAAAPEDKDAQNKPYFGGSTKDIGIAGTTGRRSERGVGPGSITPSGIGAGGTGYAPIDVGDILRGMPPERIAEIQRTMQRGGLLPENYRSFGFVDSTMRTSFGEVLGMANLKESDYTSVLEDLGTAASTGSGRDAGRLMKREFERQKRDLDRQRLLSSFGTSLQTYERSDPAGVRQTAEAAFQKALGRKPRPREMDRFVNGFLGREQGVQAGVFGAQDRLAGAERSRSLASFDAETGLMTQQNATEDALGELDTGTQPAPAEAGSESDTLWERVQQMLADAPGSIKAGSRSRSYDEQVKLYARYKAGGPRAAKPGTSKHGDGRANDLKYGSDEVRQWALKNAGKYGLAFPIYNPNLARSHDESWHVELAGSKSGNTRPATGGGGVGRGVSAPISTGGMGVAPISESITVQGQDVGAQALEFARNSNPVESQAYDVGQQFQNLVGILQKGVI